MTSAPELGEMVGRDAETACLASIATSEPCQPHATDLRRCTICGFVVDVAYEATPPTVKGIMVGRPSGSDNPDPTLALATHLQAALCPLGHALGIGDALVVARGILALQE